MGGHYDVRWSSVVLRHSGGRNAVLRSSSTVVTSLWHTPMPTKSFDIPFYDTSDILSKALLQPHPAQDEQSHHSSSKYPLRNNISTKSIWRQLPTIVPFMHSSLLLCQSMHNCVEFSSGARDILELVSIPIVLLKPVFQKWNLETWNHHDLGAERKYVNLRKQERTIINVVGSPVQREGTKIEVPGGWDMLMWQRLNVIEKKDNL